MNAHLFLAKFGHIANAPGGVARLRELVLQLGVSGRLVDAPPMPSRASAEIDEAERLKSAYEKQLGLKATHQLPECKVEPFSIPSHWQWVPLGNVSLYIQRGKGPVYAEQSTTRVISQKCVQWSGFNMADARYISESELSGYGSERYLLNGDLLLNSTGTGTVGRAAIYNGTESLTVADSHVTVIRLANMVPRYLWFVLASPFIQIRIEPTHSDSLVSGTTKQVELATAKVRSLPIPFPPINEQQQIIAAVDHLMKLCDDLERLQEHRRTLRQKLRRATLSEFCDAANVADLATGWSRLEKTFSSLLADSSDTAILRDALLALLVRGALTEQRSDDTPASNLLADIKTLREQAKITSRRLSSQQRPDSVENLPNLPTGWVRVRLGDLGYLLGGGTPDKGNPDYWNGEVPWVSPKDMKVRYICSSRDTITEEAVKRTAVKIIPESAVLFVVRGMILTHSFPAAVTRTTVTINQDMKALCPYLPEMADFLWLIIAGNKSRLLQQVERSGHGTRRLGTDKFESLIIGLPPIEEQRRILATAEKLMTFCDKLGKWLDHKNNVARRLAAAATSSLTGIASPEDDESLKAPQTELIAPVRIRQTPDIKAQAPLAAILVRQGGELTAKDLWQRFGGGIDAFYAQLKTEVAHGWIMEPEPATMHERDAA